MQVNACITHFSSTCLLHTFSGTVGKWLSTGHTKLYFCKYKQVSSKSLLDQLITQPTNQLKHICITSYLPHESRGALWQQQRPSCMFTFTKVHQRQTVWFLNYSMLKSAKKLDRSAVVWQQAPDGRSTNTKAFADNASTNQGTESHCLSDIMIVVCLSWSGCPTLA